MTNGLLVRMTTYAHTSALLNSISPVAVKIHVRQFECYPLLLALHLLSWLKLAETAQFPSHPQMYVLHPAIAMANELLIDHFPSVCPTVLIIVSVRIPSIYMQAKTCHISENITQKFCPCTGAIHWITCMRILSHYPILHDNYRRLLALTVIQ